MAERVLSGRYRIERKLGEGGMAEVWLARDLLEERSLALKLLRPAAEESGREGNRDYFMHEFRVLSRLEHKNLVRVYDFVDDPEGCFYTCEYLAGEDLFQATRDLDLEELYEVVRQVLEALAFVHDRGLVHYDVKPENVNVRAVAPARPGGRATWEVKLVDFGLTGAATTTRGARIKGTVHYVAPEVAKSLPSDHRADLYSLGVSLYYVLTRKLPYEGGSAISIIRKHLEQVPEPPSQLRPDLPEAWAAFLLRLMEKDPARRYPTAPDALGDLSRRLGKPYVAPPRVGGERALAPSFVGRRAELERLEALLPARDGAGGSAQCPGVAWIVGEEGMGKTRLVHELKVLAQLQGVPVLEAACVEGGEPLRERILRLLLTLPGAKALAEPRREALEALAPGLLGGPEEREGPAPEELPEVLDRAAELALLLARERPYALLVEDGRRADEVSLVFLAALVRRLAFSRQAGPAPLLVLTDRPAPASLREGGPPPGMVDGSSAGGLGEGSASERLSGALEAARLQGRLTALELSGLSEEECGAMVASMLALPDTPAPLRRRVFEVSGGNPFFVLELVGSLLEEGLVSLRQADLGPEQLTRIDPPSSVAELLGQRLKRMPEETRVVLQALAVLEAPSGLELLARTAERPAEATLDALDVLLRRHLVVRLDHERGGPPTYQPAHGAVQRSVLRAVPRGALEAFHGRALLALEALHPENPAREAVVERLARHAWQGGDMPRALRYAVAAGLRARSGGNAGLAVAHLERALDLLRWEEVVADPEARRAQEAEILTRLSEALTIAGRYRDAGQALEELLALGEGALDGLAGVWVRRRLGDLALRRGSPTEARRWLGEALQAAGDDPARRAERARVLEVMSRSTLWQGDYLQVIALASEAAAIFRALGRERDALWAVGILCIAEYHRGQSQAAAGLLAEALRLIRGDEPGWRAAFERLGLDAAASERFDQGLRAEQADRPLRRDAGDAFGLMLTFSELGAFFDFRAGLGLARDFYAAFREASERRGDAQRTALSLNNLGVLERQAGSYGRALEALERALAIHEGTQDRPGAAVALMNLALLRLQLGELAGARARAERALAVAREIGITWLTGHGHRALGRVLAAQGLTLEADRELGRAAGVFRLIGNPRSLLDVLLDRSEVAAMAGDLEHTQQLLARARAQAGDDPPLDFLARERLIQGELVLLSDPRRAVDCYESALRAATRAGIAELELEARRALALAGLHLRTVRMSSEHHAAAQALERRLLAGVDPALLAGWARTPGAQRGRETDRQLEERLLEG